MKLKVKETFTKLLDTTPIGKIVMYAGSSAPRGWLLCQGQAVSRTTYAKLFSVIGTTYGNGDGSTTFNVPDMRDRVPVCVGTTFGLAAKGGTTDVPYHRHSVSAFTSGTPSNNTSGGPSNNTSGTASPALTGYGSSKFSLNPGSGGYRLQYYNGADASTLYAASHSHSLQSHTHSLQNHTHSVGAHNTDWVGNSSYSSNPNMPPYLGINFLIYVGG